MNRAKRRGLPLGLAAALAASIAACGGGDATLTTGSTSTAGGQGGSAGHG